MTAVQERAGTTTGTQRVTIAIVGAGFTGLGMAIRLAQAGITDYVVLERADDIGGTWRDNVYPGCAVDVRSHLYSYSFAPNPEWTQVYAGQEELWAYIKRVAGEHGVLDRLRLRTELRSGDWDGAAQRWRLQTSTGEIEARFVVSAMGPLSNPKVADLSGLATFEGHVFHSGRWDHSYDLAGKRVGVVGTGSSAAQFVPEIQPVVEHLTVFQRTPHWTFPRLNRRITGVERAAYRRFPALQKLVRFRQYWYHELMLGLSIQNPWLTETISRLVLRFQVRDPELRARLTPDYRMGCKRIVITDAFLPALAAPNTTVVSAGIREVTPTGVVDTDGAAHRLDTLVLATGYEVMPVADPLRGRDGVTLSQRWANGRSAHLGTAVHGLPNYFMLVGPNTATGHTSILLYAEPQIDYIIAGLRHAQRHGVGVLEVRQEAQERYTAEIQGRLHGKIWFTGGCDSWYLNDPNGSSVLWPGLTEEFKRVLRRFDHENYLMQRSAEVVAPV